MVLQSIQPLDQEDTLQDCSEDLMMEELWEEDPESDEVRYRKRTIYLNPAHIILIEPHPFEAKWLNLELSTGSFLVVDADLQDLITKLLYVEDQTSIKPLQLTRIGTN